MECKVEFYGKFKRVQLDEFPIFFYFSRSRLCREVHSSDNIEHKLPLRISVPLVVIYMLICAIIVYEFDYERAGDEEGLTFGDACYFSFISMTTIGLGDVMPNHIQYSPFVNTLFMIGLVLFSVINSTIYMRMEQNYFDAMEAMEEALEEIHAEEARADSTRGHKIFRDLSDAFRIAAMAVPEMEEESNEQHDEEHEIGTVQTLSPSSYQTHLTATTSAPQRRRRGPSTSSDIGSFYPALGVLGFNLSSKRCTTEESKPQEESKPAVAETGGKRRSDSYLVFNANRPRRISQHFRRSLRYPKRIHPIIFRQSDSVL